MPEFNHQEHGDLLESLPLEQQANDFDTLIGNYTKELTENRVKLAGLDVKMKEFVSPSAARSIELEHQATLHEVARLEGVIDKLKVARDRRNASLEERFGAAANDEDEHPPKMANE